MKIKNNKNNNYNNKNNNKNNNNNNCSILLAYLEVNIFLLGTYYI